MISYGVYPYSTLELLPLPGQAVFLNFESSDDRFFSAVFLLKNGRPLFRVREAFRILRDYYLDEYPMGERACFFRYPFSEMCEEYIKKDAQRGIIRNE